MSIEQEKMIVEALPSLYPLQEFEEKAIQTILDALPSAELSTNLAEVGTDAISRQDALEAFGLSEKTRKYGGDHSGYDTMMMYEIQDTIEDLPSIQPEIIRCKDCKNWDTTWTNDFSPNYHYCPMVDGVRKEDWFCADAERRTDERSD